MHNEHVIAAKGDGWRYGGVRYTSLQALCAANNADYYRTYYRVRQGWPLRDALQSEIYVREPTGPARAALLKVQAATTFNNPHESILSICDILDTYFDECEARAKQEQPNG